LYDKSRRPYKLNTTLTKQQEELICFFRKQFKKSIDDIYLALKDKIPRIKKDVLKKHHFSTIFELKEKLIAFINGTTIKQD